jgi:hypothetical protein
MCSTVKSIPPTVFSKKSQVSSLPSVQGFRRVNVCLKALPEADLPENVITVASNQKKSDEDVA